MKYECLRSVIVHSFGISILCYKKTTIIVVSVSFSVTLLFEYDPQWLTFWSQEVNKFKNDTGAL